MAVSEKNPNDKIIVKIAPFGPNPKSINSITSKLLTRPKVRSYLKNTSDEGLGKNIENRQALRLLSFELLPEPIIYNHGIYLARYYDYNSNHCITIKGKLGHPNPTEIVESKQQPLPNNDEFE